MNRGQAAPHSIETVKELLDSDRQMIIGLWSSDDYYRFYD